jgi:hypothetical protein
MAVKSLNPLNSSFGVPHILVSDNATQFFQVVFVICVLQEAFSVLLPHHTTRNLLMRRDSTGISEPLLSPTIISIVPVVMKICSYNSLLILPAMTLVCLLPFTLFLLSLPILLCQLSALLTICYLTIMRVADVQVKVKCPGSCVPVKVCMSPILIFLRGVILQGYYWYGYVPFY